MPFSYVDGVECSGVDNSVGVWERGSVGVWGEKREGGRGHTTRTRQMCETDNGEVHRGVFRDNDRRKYKGSWRCNLKQLVMSEQNRAEVLNLHLFSFGKIKYFH